MAFAASSRWLIEFDLDCGPPLVCQDDPESKACVFVPSGKLSTRQANRRNEPQESRVGRKKVELPFFPEPGKNALIITGGWLVGPQGKPSHEHSARRLM